MPEREPLAEAAEAIERVHVVTAVSSAPSGLIEAEIENSSVLLFELLIALVIVTLCVATAFTIATAAVAEPVVLNVTFGLVLNVTFAPPVAPMLVQE